MNSRQLEMSEIKGLSNLLCEKYTKELAEYRKLVIEDIHLHNGYIIGAFEGQKLVGFAVLDCQYISGFRLRLAELIVQMNEESIQIELLERVKLKARELEAEALYICANPVEEEIAFYKKAGAEESMRVDSYLKQLYEEEIHLVMAL